MERRNDKCDRWLFKGYLSYFAQFRHHLGGGNHAVERNVSSLDPGDQVFTTDIVRACKERRVRLWRREREDEGVPAALAALTSSPLQKTATLTFFP